MTVCPDCGVEPYQFHIPGCDVERCPECGGQFLSCGCGIEPTDTKLKTRLVWTGKWPMKQEAEEYGWYAVLIPGRGWTSCTKDTPGCMEDLNRVVRECTWDAKLQKWVKQ